MANPQPDKYTKLSNELLEALAKIRVPGEAMQVFLAVMRLTYGWNRTWAHIKIGEISERTGLAKPHVSRSLKKLALMGLIIINKDNAVINNDNSPAHKYRINKDYDSWKPIKKGSKAIINNDNDPLSIMIMPVINNDNDKSPQAADSGRSEAPKESIKENKDKRERDARVRANGHSHSSLSALDFLAMARGDLGKTEEYESLRKIITNADEFEKFLDRIEAGLLKQPLKTELRNWQAHYENYCQRNGIVKPKKQVFFN